MNPTHNHADELAELEAARRELEESRRRRDDEDLLDARKALARSRARLAPAVDEGPLTYRRPPKATIAKRRSKAKAARKTRARSRR